MSVTFICSRPFHLRLYDVHSVLLVSKKPKYYEITYQIKHLKCDLRKAPFRFGIYVKKKNIQRKWFCKGNRDGYDWIEWRYNKRKTHFETHNRLWQPTDIVVTSSDGKKTIQVHHIFKSFDRLFWIMFYFI